MCFPREKNTHAHTTITDTDRNSVSVSAIQHPTALLVSAICQITEIRLAETPQVVNWRPNVARNASYYSVVQRETDNQQN